MRGVAAKLADNPHLANSGYAEQLMLLPAEVRRVLLDGGWDEAAIAGSIYGEVLSYARAEKRVGRVPYDPSLRVDTAWDLGVGDSTAIRFSQSLGRQVRQLGRDLGKAAVG